MTAATETLETGPLASSAARELQHTAGDSMKSIRVNLSQIYINRAENVRDLKSYDEQSIKEMMAQIEGVGGLLQPIGVCRIEKSPETEDKEYQLLWGYRRSIALQALAEQDPKWGMNILARLVEKGGNQSDGAVKLVQMIENMARRDLNAMEIALSVQQALEDKSADFNQKDIARLLGRSEANISQYLKLLRLPRPVQDMVSSGNLPFSHVRELMPRVPETAWQNVATKACGMAFADFMSYLDKEYPVDDGDDEKNADGTSKSSSQKPPKMLRSTDVTNKYVPFLRQQVEKADGTEKSFTAKDLVQAKLDAMKTVLLDPDTNLSKDIAPYLEEQKKREEEEEKQAEAKKAEEKFYREKIKRVEEILDAPVDVSNPNAQRPTLGQAYAQVGMEITALPEEEKKALGFKLIGDAKELVKHLSDVHAEVIKDRAEAKKKREEAKAKKEAEEKAKAANTPAIAS